MTSVTYDAEEAQKVLEIIWEAKDEEEVRRRMREITNDHARIESAVNAWAISIKS